MRWNAPDAEEPKYMVNPEGIKVIAHLLKPLLPPAETILLHPFPVISGKAPVLTNRSKIIRWSSSLLIHFIQSGIYPGITTIPVNSNGNISLKNDSFFVGIISCIFQLGMKMILNEIIKGYFFM